MRTLHLALAGLVLVAGLTLRIPHWGLPLPVHHYAGGLLWAAMLYLLAAAMRPTTWGRGACAISAGGIAICVETSRLLHGPWLDAFRETLAGQLLLGQIFSGWNLLTYVIGIGGALGLTALVERFRLRDRTGRSTTA